MPGRHKTLLDTSQIITNNYQRLLEKAGGARSSCRRQVFLPGTPSCGTPSCFHVLGIPHPALPFIPLAAGASPVLSPTPELRVGAAAAVPALGLRALCPKAPPQLPSTQGWAKHSKEGSGMLPPGSTAVTRARKAEKQVHGLVEPSCCDESPQE